MEVVAAHDHEPAIAAAHTRHKTSLPMLRTSATAATTKSARATTNNTTTTTTQQNKINVNRHQHHNHTPPDTPTDETSAAATAATGSSDSAAAAAQQPPDLFHNYLRAFHPFEPSPDDEASSITVPIKAGDLILVHSIHANGWADGTLLTTGARGWLPTNYCEAYDHPYMRNLLNAMTQFWDLLGDGENASFSTFVRQDYIRGLIAGVRYLLEHTNCLHRGAALVLNHIGVRRMRKGLLADLSSMVQKAKELQEEASQPYAGEVIHIVLDELIAKAFKVVTRAVKFCDIWMQETINNSNNSGSSNLPSREPPTPPVDSNIEDLAVTDDAPDDNDEDDHPITPHSPSSKSRKSSIQSTPKKSSGITTTGGESRPGSSSTNSITASPLDARRKSAHFSRLSVSSHRLSLVKEARNPGGSMASEQLAQSHDECISLMGQFLGHHMQSRSPTELFENTQRLVAACERLVKIMDQVRPRSGGRVVSMHQSQLVFQSELDELVKSTKEVFTFGDHPDDEVIVLPNQISRLVANGTRLIRAVGECVANTRRALEKIGDFEMDDNLKRQSTMTPPPLLPKDQSSHLRDGSAPPYAVSVSKALPMPPVVTRQRALTVGASSPNLDQVITPDTPSMTHAHTSMPPPATKYHRPLSRSPIISTSQDMTKMIPAASDIATPAVPVTPSEGMRKASLSNSSHETSTSTTVASISRDSGMTSVSDTSTRATTPEQAERKDTLIDQRLLTSFGSVTSMMSAATDASNDEGALLLHKTYAHELVLNPQGQVSKGSLPALVEQLTSHDSTPDATFTTSFYMTFRLFTDARTLAQAMIDRFEYIGDSKTVGRPVRLRICNFFKGWLENYWNVEADKDALGDVRYFAMHKVKPHLPSAADRLVEATRRISAIYSTGSSPINGTGKMGILNGDDITTPAPEPAISKSQLNAVQRANSLLGECSILDLDPLEVARQLTIMASRIYCAIQPDELLSLAWTKKDSTKAANVRSLSRLNTELSFMVNDTILSQEEAKKRALVIKQWVKIAMHSLTLQNYESVFSIVASLMFSHITRMKKTWEVVSKKTKARFEELQTVIDTSGNNAALRRRMEETMAPCIPFLGVCLGDLTFIDCGNPSTKTLPNSAAPGTGEPITVINFNKYAQMAKVVTLVKRFQVLYSLQAIPEVQTWLETSLTRMNDNPEELEKSFVTRSYALEPRITSVYPPKAMADAQSLKSPVVDEQRPRTAVPEDRKTDFVAMKEQLNFFKSNAFGFKTVLSKHEAPAPAPVAMDPSQSNDVIVGAGKADGH